jgi:hypothetical protein
VFFLKLKRYILDNNDAVKSTLVKVTFILQKMYYNYWLDYHAPSDNVYKANVSKLIVRALTFLVFRASFADEISKVSHFF